MILHNFETENTLLNQFVAELRDHDIQKDSMRFRKNIERIGEILRYELSKTICLPILFPKFCFIIVLFAISFPYLHHSIYFFSVVLLLW